jgi:predicted NUDIX family phosphoesterase
MRELDLINEIYPKHLLEIKVTDNGISGIVSTESEDGHKIQVRSWAHDSCDGTREVGETVRILYSNGEQPPMALNDSAGPGVDELVMTTDASKIISEGTVTGITSIMDFDPVFIPRKFAEQYPELKQIIPYVAIINKNLDILAYKRGKESEDRLHEFWSIGWGGHVSPQDMVPAELPLEGIDVRKTLAECVKRELIEELPGVDLIQPMFYREQYVYSEDETEVGKVHLCVAILMGFDFPEDFPLEEHMTWIKNRKLPFEESQLEPWSQVLFNHLAGIRLKETVDVINEG